MSSRRKSRHGGPPGDQLWDPALAGLILYGWCEFVAWIGSGHDRCETKMGRRFLDRRPVFPPSLFGLRRTSRLRSSGFGGQAAFALRASADKPPSLFELRRTS